MRPLLSLTVCAALCICLSACTTGPAQYKIKGKLTDNGKPLKTSVTLTLIPIVEPGTKKFGTYIATFPGTDGSFVVNGRDNEGIPPGNYRITILQMATTPTDEMNVQNEQFNKENSPIVREIVDDKKSIDIDLAKP